MSDKSMARRTLAEVTFDGVNRTKPIQRYLLSITYTDNEEDETDDLQIRLQDRDGIWVRKWLGAAIEAAASKSKGFLIQAVFIRQNWNGDGKDKRLDCGQFSLDAVTAEGPPSIITIKGTALPYGTKIRQTQKSKAWEGYSLSGIAKEIASKGGMKCLYESTADPKYKRVEQAKTSDIKFLSRLCRNAGISLKVSNNVIVLFDKEKYEAKSAVYKIKNGDGKYGKYRLQTGETKTKYTSCLVSYTPPSTGKKIEGIATVEDYKKDGKNNQQLEITAKVRSIAEAKKLAEKRLQLANKYSLTATFDLPGNPALLAGVTVSLSGFGYWSGKYIISQARHTLDASGYRTQIKLRKVMVKKHGI